MWKWPRHRRPQPELLETAEPVLADRNLCDLARINRWFGGHRALLQILGELAPVEPFTLLDIGAGSGDMGWSIGGRFPGSQVTSLDRRRFHLRRAQSPRVAADAFQLPFRHASFDFVLCSSLLHHFSEDQAVELIAALRPFARRALIILDLERHPLPYCFLPVTRWILNWSHMTVHDGCISVGAAFRPMELLRLAHAAGIDPASVRRHRPWFRMSLVVSA
ncbi:MAG TPA: methyltransferase domain-containing protein [Bryobacteraceae bacterium]|nr:methyltransferase domain-containing protein [Bryobacteraceae bacterium]